MFQSVSRREFLKLSSSAAVGSLLALTVLPKSGHAVEVSGTLKTAISSNHGHVFVADLKTLFRNGAKAYDIRGGSSHSHTVTITPQILATLQQTKVVDVDSTITGGHAHTVRLAIV